MLTPLDIQNKKFPKSPIGFNQSEVEEFLALVVASMEELIQINIDNTSKVNELEASVEKYKTMEKTIHEAMVLAQKTSDEMIKNAHEKADFIIDKAENKAKELINGANDEVLTIIKRKEEAKHDLKAFEMKYRVLLEKQLEALNDLAKE